jgi:hypothetical protein
MHAVPALAALAWSAGTGLPAVDRADRRPRHAADRGTRQDQPHSPQTRWYSPTGQNRLIPTR